MLLKNTAARLITIHDEPKKNFAADGITLLGLIPGKIYKIKPASEAIDVPDRLVESNIAIKALLKDGSLVKVSESVQPTSDQDANETGALDRDSLITYAESLGIKIDGRWSESKIAEAIKQAQAD